MQSKIGWLVLSQSYHGHADMFTSLTDPSIGVPKDENIKVLFDDYKEDEIKIADAVIIEPISLEMTDKRKNWLIKLRNDCTKHDTVLIFDETITAPRMPKYTVAQTYGIEPDLIVMGKALANGLPLSIVGGKREIMDCGEYFISSTFSGDTLALAGCIATLEEIQKRNHEEYFEKANVFMRKVNELLSKVDVKIDGYGTRGMYPMTTLNGALVAQELCKAGVLFGKAYFYGYQHIDYGTDEVVLEILRDVTDRVRQGTVKLEGKMPVETFKRS